jgi:hypothetical protein
MEEGRHARTHEAAETKHDDRCSGKLFEMSYFCPAASSSLKKKKTGRHCFSLQMRHGN